MGIDGKCWKYLDMAGKIWKVLGWLEMGMNNWKLLQMPGHG